MAPGDGDALLEFFRRVPEEDRFYLKEDVTSPAVIERWATLLDYSRTLPLLGLVGDRIIADGTLHYRRSGSRRHVGDVRLVVDPEYRNRGVGRRVFRKLVDVAKLKGLDKLVFEIVSGTEEAARHTAEVLGFIQVAVLPDHVKDLEGNPHDVLILEARVEDIVPEPASAA
jgi:GNAT superfamily N-acetyltransferase